MEHTNLTDKHYLTAGAGNFEVFKQSVNRSANLDHYPLASSIEQNAVVYDSAAIIDASQSPECKLALMAEWISVWKDGPGVLMITQALDTHTIDRANEIFEEIITQQKNDGGGSGDHFAKAGANDRIWNALEKHGKTDPRNFAAYYANEVIALASEAWLGTGYQVTSQVNRVNPGSAAQAAHRDYHLGFMTEEQILQYPLHVHRLSPALTLQGAIAHCDMPLESGPTLYLPYSQHYPGGYVAFAREEYQEYFNKNRSQLALAKGDAVFFNPALMHAAGQNKTSSVYRLANLLQVSSAFGRAMETIDHTGLIKQLFPVLKELKNSKSLTDDQLLNVISTSTDGYPFPTNLDSDLPSNGIAPKTQKQIVLDALNNNEEPHTLLNALEAQAKRKSSC